MDKSSPAAVPPDEKTSSSSGIADAIRVAQIVVLSTIGIFVLIFLFRPCGSIVTCPSGKPIVHFADLTITRDRYALKARYYYRDSIAFLVQPMAWRASKGSSASWSRLSIPKGFITDFASLPPFYATVVGLGPISADTWDTVVPAILHDYAYWEQSISREEADRLFYDELRLANVSEVQAGAMYWAVRLLGWRAWNMNAAERSRGVKKVMVQLPGRSEDLATWLRRPDVF